MIMSDRGDHGLNARALTFGHCTPPLDHPRFPKAVNSQMHGVLYKLSVSTPIKSMPARA